MKVSLLYLLGCVAVWLCPTVLIAQTPITIGQSYTLNSRVLDEEREIQIYLPKTYRDNTLSPQHYPVVYLLDSESNFHYFTAYIEKLSKYPYPAIPEMIVVGIVNTNRTRDLTPTVRNESVMTAEQKAKIKGESGGNALFFQFLEQEVKPFVQREFRTHPYTILVGHSFGGITALNHLLNYTTMFQAYIVHDPSIWWDDTYILQSYQANASKDFQHRTLFLTQVGDSENKGHLEEHYTAIQAFNQYLTQHAQKNLTYRFQQYEGENHGSIPMKGNLDGLRYIFENYPLNFKEIQHNPDLVRTTFKRLSESLHAEFQPNEAYLKYIISYYTKQKNTALVEYFIAYCLELYPTSSIGQDMQSNT